MQPIDSKVIARIKGKDRGWVFTPSHFLDLGPYNTVRQALLRFAREGAIRQLAPGLYDYPIEHPTLGKIAASTDAIAQAMANRDAIRLQPAGAYAANILGLSEQVPVKAVFLTDGSSRRIKLGRHEIVFKRTTPRHMATAGRKSGTVIQALRYIGQRNVDVRTLAILQRQMNDADKRQLLKDLKYAPAWIAKIMRQLATEPSNQNG